MWHRGRLCIDTTAGVPFEATQDQKMCGIAGYSLGPDSPIDALHAARVLLASVADRGADAAGCAMVDDDGSIVVQKQPGGASLFLEEIEVPASLRQILIHVRDHTKGRPSLPANNHPIRHGRIVGVHNGTIANDAEIFSHLGCGRAEPGMTVDSEAIFALLDNVDDASEALESLRGSLAVGWFDESRSHVVHLARGFGRPLWIGERRVPWRDEPAGDMFWASTLEALEIVEEFLSIRLFKRPVPAGTILEIAGGRIAGTSSFEPDAGATWLAHPAASPAERSMCLGRLDGLIAS